MSNVDFGISLYQIHSLVSSYLMGQPKIEMLCMSTRLWVNGGENKCDLVLGLWIWPVTLTLVTFTFSDVGKSDKSDADSVIAI